MIVEEDRALRSNIQATEKSVWWEQNQCPDEANGKSQDRQ